jgi:hypothetical protein
MVEIPFFLQKGEKIIKDASVMQYYGVGMVDIGFVGGKVFGSGFFGGLATKETKKREKSIFDAQNCHVYLTNKRLVFAKAKINLLNGQETKIENVFSDIPIKSIEGMNAGTKFKMNSTIEMSVRQANGEMNTIAFAFLKIKETGTGFHLNPFKTMKHIATTWEPARVKERDEWISLIKKLRK